MRVLGLWLAAKLSVLLLMVTYHHGPDKVRNPLQQTHLSHGIGASEVTRLRCNLLTLCDIESDSSSLTELKTSKVNVTLRWLRCDGR